MLLEIAQTVLNTAYIEFVTGKRPLDQWGQFLKQWHEAGGKQLTSAANEAFKQRDELLRQIKETVTK
jgi:enamine deaminase RidA (YjgF/YER057c/UK114 family)